MHATYLERLETRLNNQKIMNDRLAFIIDKLNRLKESDADQTCLTIFAIGEESKTCTDLSRWTGLVQFWRNLTRVHPNAELKISLYQTDDRVSFRLCPKLRRYKPHGWRPYDALFNCGSVFNLYYVIGSSEPTLEQYLELVEKTVALGLFWLMEKLELCEERAEYFEQTIRPALERKKY
jgi:hypothetical protein